MRETEVGSVWVGGKVAGGPKFSDPVLGQRPQPAVFSPGAFVSPNQKSPTAAAPGPCLPGLGTACTDKPVPQLSFSPLFAHFFLPPQAKRSQGCSFLAGSVAGGPAYEHCGRSPARAAPDPRRSPAGHGEPRRQRAAAPGDGGLPLVEEVRRLRGEDRRPLPALRYGQLLA